MISNWNLIHYKTKREFLIKSSQNISFISYYFLTSICLRFPRDNSHLIFPNRFPSALWIPLFTNSARANNFSPKTQENMAKSLSRPIKSSMRMNHCLYKNVWEKSMPLWIWLWNYSLNSGACAQGLSFRPVRQQWVQLFMSFQGYSKITGMLNSQMSTSSYSIN